MKNTKNWPSNLPFHLELPTTSLYYNLEVSAHRYPNRPAIIYYDKPLTYAELKQQVDSLAGFLQKKFQVIKGDHIALYMQNSPQFIIAYYAILRTGAIVVPINAMNLEHELTHIVQDSNCKVIIYGQELAKNLVRLQITHRIAATYTDYIDPNTDLPLPDILTTATISTPEAYRWCEVINENCEPSIVQVTQDDLAVLPYTSGTTGHPKGCMHTHRSVMHTAVANTEWNKSPKDQVAFAALPLFHVSGMQAGMNTPIYAGTTIVIMARWDKRCAAMLIERYRISAWSAISSMLCDFLNQSDLDKYDLSSLHQLTGGGAAMPKAVAEKIHALWGIHYVEGYGLTETMAPTHINPIHRPKTQCLGIPIFDTESIIIDPETMEELPTGSAGEILISGPQVFLSYHNNPEANAAAFVHINGQRYFRTGDLAYVDDEGYFFMVDRLKRMINASGYKVWPAEVETLLYAHTAILEACVIACKDSDRGEGVKALVVLKPDSTLDEAALISWAREQMAAYKVPQIVEFVDHLPKNATGKLQWRALQEKELASNL
jgi:fatty-acyl-CoA synthase